MNDQGTPRDLPPTSEESIALAFADRHAHELRFVADWSRWLFFDGAHWTFDKTLHAFERARVICRELAVNLGKAPTTIASAKTVAAVERLAKADRRLAATTEQWDSDPDIFNIPSGPA
jgi:putative DNA primase/helicase